MKICKGDKGCATCDSIRDLREEQEIDSLVHTKRKSKSKAKAPADAPPADPSADSSADDPAVFRLPLKKPLCDNTTKFSKFINKRLQHLRLYIWQSTTYLTGIVW